jgi:hypothetical protein
MPAEPIPNFPAFDGPTSHPRGGMGPSGAEWDNFEPGEFTDVHFRANQLTVYQDSNAPGIAFPSVCI